MKYIALLDCNNFFVSCERVFRPDLNGKPVVVLSSNDGCVVARSQEIKDIGIPMGVPYFQIKDTLKSVKATVFSSHFSLYRDISRRVFSLVRNEFDKVEQYSIDECFIEIDDGNAEEVMFNLREKILKEIGIPVSVGIAFSKTQAKYASKLAKSEGGVRKLTTDEFGAMAERIKLGELWGVGKGRGMKFQKDGINTVADLLKLPRSTVASCYGVEGVRLWSELGGQAVYPVENVLIAQKSIMSTRSFKEVSEDKNAVFDALLHHLHQVVKDLVAMGLSARKIRLMIAPSRHGSYAFYARSKEVILLEPTADLFVLTEVIHDAFEEIFIANVPYKRAGVVVSDLVSSGSKTPALFTSNDKSSNKDTEFVTETLLKINQKLGSEMVQLGRIAKPKTSWAAKRELLSPSYTTTWKDIKVVKA